MSSHPSVEWWAEAAAGLEWHSRWHTVYDSTEPPGRWFVGGTLNAAVNCLGRYVADSGRDVALCWEGEPGDRRTMTFSELHAEVGRLAGALRRLGVQPGDRIALHLGGIPETVAAVLACGWLGAVYSVLPVLLPVEAVTDRLEALAPKILFAQDIAYRRGKPIPIKERADEALSAMSGSDVVEHQIVIRRGEGNVDWYEGDLWYHDLLGDDTVPVPPPAPVAADHPLLIDFLASREHRPVTIRYRTAGILLSAREDHRRVLTRRDGDMFWCATELNHEFALSHGIYGPLVCGAPVLMVEGTADTPSHARPWEIMERYGVNSIFTLTPACESTHRWWRDEGTGWRNEHLRLVVTGGAPVDPSTVEWLRRDAGADDIVVSDGWGQLETGALVLVHPPARGEGTAVPHGLDIVDQDGTSISDGDVGELVISEPWPGMFLDIQGHPDTRSRYWRYWDRRPGTYATGDRARRRPDGSVEFLGRIDPIVKVHGQLVTLTDIISVLVEHPFVEDAEVADIHRPAAEPQLVAWVVLTGGVAPGAALAEDLRRHVHEALGGLAHPSRVGFAEGFPPDIPRRTLREALKHLGGQEDVVWRASVEDIRKRLQSAEAQPSEAFIR